MREIEITYTGPDLFDVKSKKQDKEDVYVVDISCGTCTCKSWYYSKQPKTCTHLKSVMAALKDDGKGINWNQNEKHEIATKNEVSEDFQILFRGVNNESKIIRPR